MSRRLAFTTRERMAEALIAVVLAVLGVIGIASLLAEGVRP